MVYFIESRNIANRKKINILNEEDELVGVIKFHKKSADYPIEITNMITAKTYQVQANPLKLKGRFIVFSDNKQVAKISLGIKIIHSVVEQEKYFFVKAAFWKIKYQLYLNREVLNTLSVIRKEKKRFYKVESKDDDFINVISLFLLARAIRIKVLLS